MADNSNNEPQRTERPIRTLKGLLKFCMDATKSEDTTGASSYEAMSEERKQWLDEALKTMTVNSMESVSECLKVIENSVVDTEEGTNRIIMALTELQDWVEDLDIAQDFITIKGLRVIPSLISSEVSEIRWRSLELLANMCQNNPKTQLAVLQSHFIPPILLLVDTDPNPTVRVKALYALSCLARSNVPVQTELFAKDGLSVLVRALDSTEEKLRLKASFLMSAISKDNPALKDMLLDKGLVEQMIVRLKKEHCPSHEHLMSAFVSLIDMHPRFRQFCLQEKFEMKSFLAQHIQFMTGKEDFEDEKLHAEQLLVALNSSSCQPPSTSAPQMALMLA